MEFLKLLFVSLLSSYILVGFVCFSFTYTLAKYSEGTLAKKDWFAVLGAGFLWPIFIGEIIFALFFENDEE